MSDSRAITPHSTGANSARKRRYWSPLSVLLVVAVATLALQYLALLGSVLLAEFQHQPFSFHLALGPLQFWQAGYHEHVSSPAPGHYVADFGGEAVIREGAVLLAVLVGSVAAVLQTRRVPVQ